MINQKRMIDEFCELVSIDSVSFHERQMADCLKEKLRCLNVIVEEDQSGKYYGSDTGNVYGYLPGDLPGEPLLFVAHMDAVEPGSSKQAIIKEDRIVSNGHTVLGADDMAGVEAILESLRVIVENHLSHRDIEVFFPIAEEAYIQGSRVFDYRLFHAKEAYVLDLSGKIGTASLKEPTLISFVIEVLGQSSHAGFAPEKGIHSIALASQAMAPLQQGRIDDETTFNIGKIHGGIATNIIPASTVIEGEIRSFDHQKALDVFRNVVKHFEDVVIPLKGKINVKHTIHLKAYQVSQESTVVQRFVRICQKLGIEPILGQTLGGSDNNSLMQHGMEGIVLACGMNQVHTTEEYIKIDDLIKSTKIVLELMLQEE